MDNAREIKNPLLEIYGAVVARCFAPGQAIRDPVVLFPGVESASQMDELSFKPDLDYLTPDQAHQETIQRTVEHLRTLLDKEATEGLQQGDQKKKFDNMADRVRAVRGQTEGIQQVSFHLEAFRNALQTGDESLLKGNPFYTLSKLIFWHTLNGSLALLGHLLEELSRNTPERMGRTHSLRAIWRGTGQHTGLLSQVMASVGLLFALSKPLLDGVLFFVSAFTSYRALLALLQTPERMAWFNHYFTQSQGDLLQVTLATLGSLLLGVVVMDFRARLLQGAAETGALFSGLRAAFLLQPRWLFLAFCLTLFSVQANYGSMAVIFSTQEHLSEQWQKIHQQVEQALGKPDRDDPANPQALYSLQARLQAVATDMGERFARIPEEELAGKATSADPRKGPRYWAKYFIVNGGFVLGTTDVVHAFRAVQFARNVDQQLKESGLPLDKPLAQRMQAVADLYTTDLAKTTATIQKDLAELDRLMPVGTLSLPAIQKIYSFDYRLINQNIQDIAQALQASRTRFRQIVHALDQLTESHIRVLAQMDRSGEPYFNSLRLGNRLAIPPESPADTPSLAFAQQADQKSFAALTTLLIDHYGGFQGKALMALILFLSIAIDGLPWLLFGRATARQGVLDGQMADDLLNYMKEWEEAFIDLTKSFFYRPSIQKILQGITFPNETGVRNAFFKVLEEMDVRVKDARDQDTMTQRQTWLRGLFVQPRTLYAMGYNARVRTIETLSCHPESALPLLIRHLFPGLPYGKKYRDILEKETFLDFYQKTETGQTLDKAQFSAELDRIGAGDAVQAEPGASTESDGSGFFSQIRQQLMATLHRIPLRLPSRHKGEEDQWTTMMQKAVNAHPTPPPTTARRHPQKGPSPAPESQEIDRLPFVLFELAFREPYPLFPHTRRNWLLSVSSVHEETLEDLDTLHDFIPDFVKMLKKVMTNTLPIIQESLEPLEEICARFPTQCAAEGIVGTEELKERFRALEKESLGMWGACVSHLLGDGTVAQFQTTDNPELAGLLAAGGDISQFYDRIHTLMTDAKASAQRAKAVEESILATVRHSLTEIKNLCDSTNQMLIKINMLSLDLRRQRPLPHLKLRALNEGSSVLDRAPRDVKMLLDARERVLASENLFSDDNFRELSQLNDAAHALHDRVDTILNLVDR